MSGALEKPDLLFELARGGMGAVHLARVVGIGGFERFVVVKRILDATGREAETLDRFLNEARIAARIHHANVVGTHHVGIDDGGLYMVLDYVEGGSLAALTDRAALRGERLPIPIVLRIALDALAGLTAVHRATDNDGTPLGIVHRDVSLQNILVGRDGVARLTDFGIARSTQPSIKTKTGSLIGKLLYLPPEHIRQEPTDHTIDIYMLGITLWCALTGEEPWQGSDEAQLMHRILNEPVPTIASRRNEPVAPEIERLISTAVDPVAQQRYASAAEMAQVIEALGRERGWVASQHEVASYVEGLLGVDLDRRRERIAQLAKPLSSEQGRSDTLPRRTPRATVRLLWAVAIVLLALTGITFWPTAQSATTRQNDDPARQTGIPTAAEPALPAATTLTPSAAATAPTPASIAPRSEPPSTEPPSTEPPSTETPSTETRPTGAAPPVTSIRNPTVAQTKASPAKPKPSPQKPVTKPTAPLSAPDEISPRNPYRPESN
jgi:serine/threonine-protein kinase